MVRSQSVIPAESDINHPSTPPDTGNGNHPPPSHRRESSRVRTPSHRPGFIPIQGDSRRSLVPESPAPANTERRRVPKNNKKIVTIHSEDEDEGEPHPTGQDTTPTNPFSGTKQVDVRTGAQVTVDTAQDSDAENKKCSDANKKKKESNKDKDGFDHARLYFYPPGGGPKQDPTDTAWACRWCPNEFKTSGGSYYNLKSHRDGAQLKGSSLQSACPGRANAIKAGAHLPPTAAEQSKVSNNNNGEGTLIAYVTKSRFDNQTLNKLLVLWLIRHSLPWLRVEDFLLRVSFDYTLPNADLNSRVWAASHAHQLYLEQQSQVLKAIRASDSKVSLVSGVWTTKGSHKAFLGMACCYITPEWKYVCQHLAIKYVSWHHNGEYLAVPFANVLTTDSGSNNFTMARGVASIFRWVDATDWEVQSNHHWCTCHVIALILGAGLKALNLSKTIVCPEKADKYFPKLSTIIEVLVEDSSGEDIELVEPAPAIAEQEVDPDDAKKKSNCKEPGWESGDDNTDEEADEDVEPTGIAFTLKKVCNSPIHTHMKAMLTELPLYRKNEQINYICRRIASSPQKQAEYRLWANKLNYKGPGIIAGYGIRWNIAYESRSRAYDARKVINQLLDNESDRHTGRAAEGHYFKAYELSKTEWKDVNDLNQVLKEFLDMTKRMEGDGPKLAMVLYEYVRMLDSLEKKKEAANLTVLEPMFEPMITITQKYVNLALKCEAVILATFLHPAWRMMLFNKRFNSQVQRITQLIQSIFEDRESHLKSLQPDPSPKDSPGKNNDH
ncbi:hypothetical protein PTTG_30178, partial [Puccinia triticina 1-1 BBBD Race 1]